jgi:hypothetical protein
VIALFTFDTEYQHQERNWNSPEVTFASRQYQVRSILQRVSTRSHVQSYSVAALFATSILKEGPQTLNGALQANQVQHRRFV